MKIAFVNDSCERLGVEYISAVLKKGGHTVKSFIDPQLFNDVYTYFKSLSYIFDYKKRIINELKVYKPDLIGISIDTEYYQWACSIAKMIKEKMDTPIIFGGIHPTSVPERVIKNDFVDMVCVGEGEYPMLELANSLQKGSIDYSIKNIWFKKNGQIIQNQLRSLIENLDELPFADHDIYYEASPHFKKGYYIVTVRGCPYACSYCCHSYFHELYKGKGKYLRQRSVKNVIHELVEAKRKYNINTVIFLDDCFAQNINWLREFSDKYKKEINVKFTCAMHPEHVSLESVRYLKVAGCRQITLGIQSWDENIRKHLLNRHTSNEVMKEAMRLIQKEKIDLLVDNIFGFPNQGDDDFMHSLLFYTQIKPTRIFFYKLKYFPSITITRKAKEYGLLSTERFEEILEGKKIVSVYFDSFLNRKIAVNSNVTKIKILLFLLDCIPSKIAYYIIQKRFYRHFPSIFNPTLLILLRTMLSSDIDTRILRTRTFCRYSHFIGKYSWFLMRHYLMKRVVVNENRLC